MASSENRLPEDAQLTQYLLGRLPEKETERLDELSVRDEEFAWRLNAVENDLVDAYVRGELSPDDEKQFKAAYLSSSSGKEKVQFARGLLEFERRAAAATTLESPGPVSEIQGPRRPAEAGRHLFPRFALLWGFATASLALLIIGGLLLVQNVQLRRQLSQAEADHAALDRRAQSLQKQLEEEAERNEKPKGQENARPSRPNLDQLTTVSVLLPPPMRGASQVPTLSLHPGTDLVVTVLSLEANDFPAYRATLRDPATKQTLWQSSRLSPGTGSQGSAVSVTFSASLLKQQNYIIDLVGIPSHGGAEAVGGYPFRVVLQ